MIKEILDRKYFRRSYPHQYTGPDEIVEFFTYGGGARYPVFKISKVYKELRLAMLWYVD